MTRQDETTRCMQQDVGGGVDSAANVIRRIARPSSKPDTIGLPPPPLPRLGRADRRLGLPPLPAVCEFLALSYRPTASVPVCDRSATSPKWPISAISLINILDVERRSAACDRRRRVCRSASLNYQRPTLSLNAVTSDNSSSCAPARRGANEKRPLRQSGLRARTRRGQLSQIIESVADALSGNRS